MDLSASTQHHSPLNDTRERVKLLVCVAPGCENNSVNNKNVQFHSFPATQVGKLWQATLGIVASRLSSMATVCSKHFRNEDYLEEKYLEGTVETICLTLKPDAVPCTSSSQSFKTPQEFGNTSVKEDKGPKMMLPENEKSYKTREDKALGIFTQRFVEMLKACPDGLLDINEAVRELKISRRRIYDITNVLEGVFLLKKKSKRFVQWVGPQPKFLDGKLGCLIDEENKLDGIISYTKRQIRDMYENILNNQFAYLTYEDIQSIPIFEDQAVFVIKAPRETTLEVAHPKEAFQMHIISKTGPVEILGCTDSLDVTQRKTKKSKYVHGDYSNLPLRGLSTAATSCKDNANHNTNCPSEPTQLLSQVPNMPKCPASTSVLPPHEEQLNSSPPILPLSICVKEEMDHLNITPDEPLNESFAPASNAHDQLSTDVHMTDLS